MFLISTVCPLNKITSSRLEETGYTFNAWKQMQRLRENEEIKEYVAVEKNKIKLQKKN